MKPYNKIFRLSLQQLFQYRMNIFMFIIFGFLPLLAMLYLWITIYEGKDTIQGFSLQEMITYVLLAKLLEVLLLPDFHWSINTEIRKGELSKYLVKPLSYSRYWFARNLAVRTSHFVLAIIPIVWIIGSMKAYTLPIQQHNVLLFLLSVLGSFILYFLMYYQISLLTIWFIDVSSFFFTVDILLEFLAGTIIPLSLLPNWLYEILKYLPFSYLIYFPTSIYLGKFLHKEIWWGLCIQGTWILVFLLTSRLLWLWGLKKYDSVGA
ncbi:ABC transporter permease [Marininema halotolerans]|uniref:ABC-2 type transport system permease protein n=1 Tax=Marininema halotolerans TaxID=1155944 RepID=A0A1I6P6J4_9BACL|nr:ABC-2 family transporter protein [Marininema halotolerans]SFS35740.1 ABC-2 type transport system permease protein [Marininema halotolerans]